MALSPEASANGTHSRSAGLEVDRLDTLYGTIANGVMVHAPDGRMVYANPAAAELLGAPAAELVRRSAGYSFWSAVDGGGRPVSRTGHPTWRALATARPVPTTLIRIDSVAGQHIWMSVSATPLKDPGGSVSGVLTMFQDVTSTLPGARSTVRSGPVQELAESLASAIRGACGILLLRPESTQLELVGLHCPEPFAAGVTPVFAEPAGGPTLDDPGLRELLNSGEPAVRIGEAGIADDFGWASLIRLPADSSLALIPIGEIHAFGLAVVGRGPGEAPLEKADCEALAVIIRPAQVSLAAGRTEIAAARRLRRLRALASLERTLDFESSTHSRLEKILTLLVRELGLRRADLWVAGPEGEISRIAASPGPAGAPNFSAALQRLEDLVGTQWADFTGLPVRWAGVVVGVAGLGIPPGALPDDEWWDFAELVAGRLGAVLQRKQEPAAGSPDSDAGPPLSESETRVYELLRKGLTNGEIAQQLFLSENTIKFHVSRIFRKLGVRNRVEAVRLARQG